MSPIQSYFTDVEYMIRSISQAQLETVFRLLEDAYFNGRRIFTMGNGGSAATSSHLALDLAKNIIAPGVPRVKAISLTDHVPLITAWSNDTAYEHIFAEQLETMIEPGDVVIAISASGNSPNLINALHLAKRLGGVAIGLLGAEGGKIKHIVDAYVLAPGQNIEQEQDAHLILAHLMMCHMRAVLQKIAARVAVPTGSTL